ncbi:MAG: Asp-tRNA(Asn)/Glu-tRNA(Gln) amidotransferase subunit GatC [Polyangiaceae bacterium]|nr:Asp-tRNA(Asn)/Glu-tRNA(Gln) amidotransferase subunit GatC [Polyangiaceae bacterium]
MSVTREDVLHVAALAKLRLGEEEIERMRRDLARILGYVELLGELSLDDVEPTAHVAVDTAPLRPDSVVPGLTTGAALAEAPRTLEGGFAVPAFLDEG